MMNRSLSRTLWVSCRTTSIPAAVSSYHASLAIRLAHKQGSSSNASRYVAYNGVTARSFATRSTTSTKASSTSGTPKKKTAKSSKKPKKKKTVAKKKPQRKIVKKPLDENTIKIRKVRDLKQQALANDIPKLKPASPYQVYTAEAVTGTGYGSIGERMKDIGAKYRNMTTNEKSTYVNIAQQNKEANQKLMKAWVLKYTAEEIRQANNARRTLNRLAKEPLPPGRKVAFVAHKYRLLEDPRHIKKVDTPYIAFVRERWASGDFKGLPAPDVMRTLGMEFKNLSTSELNRLRARYEEDLTKFTEEYNRISATETGKK